MEDLVRRGLHIDKAGRDYKGLEGVIHWLS
jgi:hypothetical protein